MASMRPEYNDKVHFMVSLAPVAFMARVKSPIRLLTPFVKDLEVSTNRPRTDVHLNYRASRLTRRATPCTECRALNSSLKCDLLVLRLRLNFRDFLENKGLLCDGKYGVYKTRGI
jgi:hypothetical protein